MVIKAGIPTLNSRFIVKIDGIDDISFSSISEIADSSEVIEYRDISRPFSIIKVPGATSFQPLRLLRGITKSDALQVWRNAVVNFESSTDKDVYRNVIINILDTKGKSFRIITLKDAWPSSYVSSDLNAITQTILIESLELQYSSKTVKIS